MRTKIRYRNLGLVRRYTSKLYDAGDPKGWMEGRTCLNCLNCQLINRRRNLQCRANRWPEGNVELIPYEKRTLEIRVREVFQTAEKCQDRILKN